MSKPRQPDLFADWKPDAPFQQHSPTSADAAAEIQPRAETLRRAVLEFLKSRHPDGATDEEIQEALAMSGSTQRPRRVELVEMHMVRDSGTTRPTRSGRHAVVWVATA